MVALCHENPKSWSMVTSLIMVSILMIKYNEVSNKFGLLNIANFVGALINLSGVSQFAIYIV